MIEPRRNSELPVVVVIGTFVVVATASAFVAIFLFLVAIFGIYSSFTLQDASQLLFSNALICFFINLDVVGDS